MAKTARAWIFHLTPYAVVGIAWLWNHLNDAWQSRELSKREVWMTGVQAYILVDDGDRFTHTNFLEWQTAFMKANDGLTFPDVEFTQSEHLTPHPILPANQ